MIQPVSRRPLNMKARVRSQASPCEIYCGLRGTRTGFPPSTSVFSCQYYTTSAPYSF